MKTKIHKSKTDVRLKRKGNYKFGGARDRDLSAIFTPKKQHKKS